MSPPPEHTPPVLQEIRQRRVGKVVIAYIALGFAIVEASGMLLPLLPAPEWADRFVLGVLVLGFPATVVLAWTFDITPAGVVRTPDDLSDVPDTPTSPAWLVLTALGLAAGAVLHAIHG